MGKFNHQLIDIKTPGKATELPGKTWKNVYFQLCAMLVI